MISIPVWLFVLFILISVPAVLIFIAILVAILTVYISDALEEWELKNRNKRREDE